LVEALRYKPEGRGFDSRWCHWNFSLTQSFRPHYGPGVDSASNRNVYQEYFLGVKALRVTTKCAVLDGRVLISVKFKSFLRKAMSVVLKSCGGL
jgi:hypothetical protein